VSEPELPSVTWRGNRAGAAEKAQPIDDAIPLTHVVALCAPVNYFW
jgi:hypothetical protein